MIAKSVCLNTPHHGGTVACPGELTIRELGTKLGIGRGTILRWIHNGKLAAHQTTEGYWHIPFDQASRPAAVN